MAYDIDHYVDEILGDNEQPDYRTVYDILSENARDSDDDDPEHDEDWPMPITKLC